MKQSLYDLSTDLERLAWMLEESGGEITEDIDRYLTDTQQAIGEKVANYVALIKNFEGIAEVKKSEVKRLGESQKADSNIAKKLRARLAWFFQRNDLAKLRTRMGTVTLTANPPKTKPELKIAEYLVPAGYQIERTITEVDYDKIRADLEAGVKLDWAYMPEQGSHITIR